VAHGELPGEQFAVAGVVRIGPVMMAGRKPGEPATELLRRVVREGLEHAAERIEVEAAAVVGSLLGAIKLAAVVSLSRGDTRDQVWQAIMTATEISLQGLPDRLKSGRQLTS
jgi:hypothetical protein